MAMGQAAGAMAVLAARADVEIQEVPVADIRDVLRTAGAIVPGDPGNPHTHNDTEQHPARA